MPNIKVLATAKATATGGRNGRTRSDDGLIDVPLSVPKSMGGPGRPGTTTPEHLFAAGYAACFGGACEFMARQLNLSPGPIEVTAEVGIGQTDSGGFGLTVVLDVRIAGLSQGDAERLAQAGHGLCPYSNAIKGNVDVALKVMAV